MSFTRGSKNGFCTRSSGGPGSAPRALVSASMLLLTLLSFIHISNSTLYYTEDGTKYNSCQTALTSVWSLNYSSGVLARGSLVSPRSPLVDGAGREGQIVIYSSAWQGVFLADFILENQRRGAEAVVLTTSFVDPGRVIYMIDYYYQYYPQFRAEVRIPVLQVVNNECGKIVEALDKDTRGLLNVTAYIDDQWVVNTYDELQESPWAIVCQLVIIVVSLAALLFALSRLIPILRIRGFELRLPQVVLSIECLCYSLRIIIGVDPVGIRAFYHPFFSYFVLTTSGAVGLIANLIVLFHWNKALDSFQKSKYKKWKRYGLIIIIAIIIAELVSASLRGMSLFNEIQIVVQVFYVLVSLGIMIYIGYTSVNLYKYFQSSKASKQQESARKKLSQMSKILVAIACLILLFAIFSVIYFLPLFKRAWTELIFWMVVISIMNAIGILETTLFQVPRSRSGSQRSDETNTDDSMNKKIQSLTTTTVKTASRESKKSSTSASMEAPDSRDKDASESSPKTTRDSETKEVTE